MVLIRHELRQGRASFVIWTTAVAMLLAVCIFIFPQMQDGMEGMSEMFASMGGFTEAFGMDRINFGTFIGFYAVECGNILGLGGALYAALFSVGALAKEEQGHTAEFLLAHPLSRGRVAAEKLAAVMIGVLTFNICVYVVAIVSTILCGEKVPFKEITLLHFAYLLMQLEIAGICFGISAFMRRGTAGVGLGAAILMYFINLIANLSKSAEFLRYITPFAYADGADIVSLKKLDVGLICLGMIYAVLGIAAAFTKYRRKDIM